METLNELIAESTEPIDLVWEYTDSIKLCDMVVFGVGYDFEGLETMRLEAKGPNGNYLIWPSNGKWSLYRDSDGSLAFEAFSSQEECEQAALRWCADQTNSEVSA